MATKTRGAPYPLWDDLIDADGAGPISTIEAIATYLQDNMAGWLKGPTAGRPAASEAVEKFLYWDEETDSLSFCVEGAWRQIPLSAPDLSAYLTKAEAAATYLALAGGTLTGGINMGMNVLQRFTAYKYEDLIGEISGISGSTPLLGGVNIYRNLTGNLTFTTGTTPGNARATPNLVIIEQNATLRAITWPTGVQWAGGSAPAMAASRTYYIVLTNFNFSAGITDRWFGQLVGDHPTI